VALCQARISTKPLWGFSSSNPYHSQSRAEQEESFKYKSRGAQKRQLENFINSEAIIKKLALSCKL
jgi:hypothetical protein